MRRRQIYALRSNAQPQQIAPALLPGAGVTDAVPVSDTPAPVRRPKLGLASVSKEKPRG